MTRPPAGRVPDAELLRRFAHHRDEAAFELLVWRYDRLVRGVCRRTAGDHHAAEDAAQATFLLLARRADAVRDPAARCRGWLARVAYRCAVRARNQASGGVSPRPSLAPNECHCRWLGRGAYTPARQDPDSLELFAALDAELDRLPDRLRLPVVLVHLDGRTYADAAQSLNIPVGTLSGRLTRARGILKDRLTRRGLAPLAVALAAADAGRVAAVARSAVLFAAGHPDPSPSASLALGVLRAMTLPKLLAATAAGLIAVTVAAVGLAQAPPPPPAPAAVVPDFARLQGEWLFESATAEPGGDALPGYWNARLTFRKTTVAVSGSPYSEAAVETTYTLDPDASPKRMDWVVPQFYRTLLKLPAGSAKGIYRLDPDGSLTVCMANSPAGERPTEFRHSADKGHFRFTVRRWTGEPGKPLTEGTVTVLDPDGKPVERAQVVRHPQRMPDDPADTWRSRGGALTAADGTARPAVDAAWTRVTAFHSARKLMAYADASPAALHHGLTVRMAPYATVSGKLAVDPQPAAGGIGWTNVYLGRPGVPGGFLAGYADRGGRFEFLAPPGDYELKCYGEVFDNKTVPLTVPPGAERVDAGTVTGGLTAWGKLVGRPAPGLPGVVKWVGEPVTLDALKGKVVLLYFPNVGGGDPKAWKAEQVAALRDRFAAKGLAVVGVVGDGTGQMLNMAAAALTLQKPPYPVALAGGLADDWGYGLADRGRFQLAAAYAAEPYPSGVLIDRRGVVRDRWSPNDKQGDEMVEKLLAEK